MPRLHRPAPDDEPFDGDWNADVPFRPWTACEVGWTWASEDRLYEQWDADYGDWHSRAHFISGRRAMRGLSRLNRLREVWDYLDDEVESFSEDDDSQ